MSQEVDSRVVEMRFDNTNFEKNTRKTIASVDRLMEKLQFKGAEKSLDKLNAAAKDVDFGPMDESLTVLERHFSAFEIVAATALVNITNKFVNAGEKLVKSLSVDQVMSGWDKYAEKTSNVQTIMNATGKSIDQVNGYLNKLMWYSDETSYSFNEMTSALSQMTAAGGRIDKMIPMIMGIANATADAGKTGFAFQSTIRNLTQSYSAGHLQLQDWKSLNLMGTATKALKQELIDTAVELGVIKEGEVTIASFESSLQKKWAKLAQTEYQIWADTYEKTASVTEKSNRNIKAINKRLAIQSEKTALAEKAWVETKNALGEASRVTQQAYQDYLEAQQEKLELESELDKAQLAAFDDLSRFYDSRISMAQKRMDLLSKLYNDGDLSGRADAYEAAVKEYGEGSLEARRAATQGTMTALMGVNSALTSMRWQMSRVTAMQQKYQTALEQAGGNRYDETVMAAYEDMMDSRSTFADYVGDLADAFDVSDATKRTMMQLGDAIAKNWKPIQNGFGKVWTQVEKRFPQMAEKLANFVGLYMRDGATETISATMNAIVSAMNGDWASAVASGLTAVLDVVGTDFGQTLTEAISTALKNAFSGNGLFAQLLSKLLGGINLGGSGSRGFFSKALNFIKSLLGRKSTGVAGGGSGISKWLSAGKSALGLGKAAKTATDLVPVLHSVGTATANVASGVTTVAKAAGVAKAAATTAGAATSGTLAKVGMGVAKVASSLGPHGLLVGACVAGAALVGTAVVKNWDKVKAGIGKAWDWIKEKASNLWSGVKGLVGGAINVGKNVVGGLWNGIKGVAGGLWNGIKGIGRGIINGFKSIFGIHSPSTVFAGIGGYLMEGLANGITNTADGVNRSLEEVTDGALDVAMSGAEHLLAALNSEDDPVIRPVVDLSDAESSLGWMDDQMAGSYTRSLNVQRSAALAGAVSAKANRQNGGDEKDAEDDRTGSENHEVVEAIRQMGERIDGVARAVSNMKVVMNSRKLVGEIKTDMNNALGAMAEKGR